MPCHLHEKKKKDKKSHFSIEVVNCLD